MAQGTENPTIPAYKLVLSIVLQKRLANLQLMLSCVLLTLRIFKLKNKWQLQAAKSRVLSGTLIDSYGDLLYKRYRSLNKFTSPAWVAETAALVFLAQRASRDYNITQLTPLLRLMAGYRGIRRHIKLMSGQ